MITVESYNCAKVLFDSDITADEVKEARNIFSDEVLYETLNNPSVDKSEKLAVMKKLFGEKMYVFLEVMNDYGHMHCVREIFEAYDELVLDNKNVLKATLSFVTRPDEKTVESFREMLKKKYSVSDVVLELKEDKSLIGGYTLQVGDTEFDKSVKGTVNALQKIIIRR